MTINIGSYRHSLPQRFACLLLAVAFALAAAPRAAVTGKVLDSVTSAPLPDALVREAASGRQALTGPDGSFRLDASTALRGRPETGNINVPMREIARSDAIGRAPWTNSRMLGGDGLDFIRDPGFAAATPLFFRRTERDISPSGDARRALNKVSSPDLILTFSKASYTEKNATVPDGTDLTMRLSAAPADTAQPCAGIPADGFCDDFQSTSPDTAKWWYARRSWGPKPPLNDGVIPENVEVRNGSAYFAANGDHYSGPLQGIYKSGSAYIQDRPGARSGGVLVTDGYFGSGRYEVRMKLPPKTGTCVAMWTFSYQEVSEGKPGYLDWVSRGYSVQGNATDGHYVVANHEIDIETPTALTGEPDAKAAFRNARFNTWTGETGVEFTSTFNDLGADMNDGKFHVYRFDWHTATTGAGPRVEFYIDGVLKRTLTTHIPTIKGRLWLGTWFPEWAGGTADYDVQHLEVDWVRILPFREAGDETIPESFPLDGLTKCRDRADNVAGLPPCRIKLY